MTTKNYTENGVYTATNAAGSVQTLGGYVSHTQSGGNRAVGEEAWVPHNYEMTHTEYRYGMYTRVSQNSTFVPLYDTFYSAGIPGCTYTAVSTNDMNALISKLGDKYNDHGFDAGIFAGELGELTNQFAGRIKQLAQIAKALKKGRFDKALDILKKDARNAGKLKELEKAASRFNGKGRNGLRVQKRKMKAVEDLENGRVSDLHLEIQYGILPTVGDIFEMSKAIQVAGKPRKKRISVSKRNFVTPIASGSFIIEATGFTMKALIGYLEEEVPSLPEQMGLTDPSLIAWELLPFSFVLDWALPVGDWLSARHAASTMKGTFVTTEYTNYLCTQSGKLIPSYIPDYAPPPTSYITGLTTSGYRRYIYVKRTVSGSLTGSVKFPKFEVPITGPGMRLANAVALVASVFLKKK